MDNVRQQLDRFTDSDCDTIGSILINLPMHCNASSNDRSLEADFERYAFILDLYQEQPHLLDPKLPEFLDRLLIFTRTVSISNDGTNPSELSLLQSQAFKFMCHLTKVRGHKVIVRLLPHEVSDLLPVLHCLEQIDIHDSLLWEARYMLLLWLTILVKIPFDLTRFDSQSVTEDSRLVERVVRCVKPMLGLAEKSRDAAAQLLAFFLTRPDVTYRLDIELRSDLELFSSMNVDNIEGLSLACGTMYTLASIFKHGQRKDLLPYAQPVMEKILALSKLQKSKNSLLRKLSNKLMQQIGLVFLPPRLASWRYKRGTRSLATTLAAPGEKSNLKSNLASAENGAEETDDADFDLPDGIEDILNYLLQGLRDRETVVRWTCAKGLGRVIGRLPLDFANEFISALLELFGPGEGDGAWQGACLTLAELGRRGLLLPDRLPRLVPILQNALVYDELRGSYNRCSVGSHVRDAACYLCWSLARAYDPVQLEPYVKDLAAALVCVALFDREINCRRAASASFQEHVGRQGTFPNGIELVVLLDFFAVGNRHHCFTELSSIVAVMEGYGEPILDHVLMHCVVHWDEEIRSLSATTLANLTPIMPQLVVDKVLTRCIAQSTSSDLYTRHGSLIATGQIIKALGTMVSQTGLDNDDLSSYVSDDLLSTVGQLPVTLMQKANGALLKGFGNEVMRVGVSQFLCDLASIDFKFSSDQQLKQFVDVGQTILLDNFSHRQETIRDSAFQSMYSFCAFYRPVATFQQSQVLLAQFLKLLKNDLPLTSFPTVDPSSLRVTFADGQLCERETDRQGAVLLIGSLQSFVIEAHVKEVIEALISATTSHGKLDKLWAESRRDAILSLHKICQRCLLELKPHFDEIILTDVLKCLMVALDDYTIDSRGDIGTCVRESAMEAICSLFTLCNSEFPSILNEINVGSAVCKCLQQCCEKIDRTRNVAANVLINLLKVDTQPLFGLIPKREALIDVFFNLPETFENLTPGANVEGAGDAKASRTLKFNWGLVKEVYPRLARLLGNPEFQYHVLLGFAVSVGGLSESVSQCAKDAFMEFLQEINENQVEMSLLLQNIANIFVKFQRLERVVVPVLKTVECILSSNYLESYVDLQGDLTPINTILSLTEKVTGPKVRSAPRLLAAASVLCGFLQFEICEPSKKLSEKALQILIERFLCHAFPRVRKFTADELYEALLMNGQLDNHSEQSLTLLASADWLADLDDIGEVLIELKAIFQMDLPAVMTNITSLDPTDGQKSSESLENPETEVYYKHGESLEPKCELDT